MTPSPALLVAQKEPCTKAKAERNHRKTREHTLCLLFMRGFNKKSEESTFRHDSFNKKNTGKLFSFYQKPQAR